MNATAPASGDGSQAHPFQRLTEALRVSESPLHIHLAPGRYTGPFELPPQTFVDGPETAVLTAEGLVTVLHAPGEVTLKGFSVVGGAEGLISGGNSTLSRLKFRGQRRAALIVSGGMLALNDTEFQTSLTEVLGLVLEKEGSARVSRTRWSGPFSTAIEAHFAAPRAASPSSLEVSDATVEGAVRGLRLVNAGTVSLRRLTVRGGSGDGVLIARTHATFDTVLTVGHEYGLSLGEGAEVEGRNLRVLRAQRAGIAITHAQATLRDVRVIQSGDFGGVQVIRGNLWMERFRIEDSQSYGLTARNSRVVLRDGTISNTLDPDGITGDGLQLRYSEAQLVSVYVDHSANYGLLSAEGSRTTLVDVTLANNGAAGAVVETQGYLGGVAVTVDGSGGPGLIVMLGSASLDGWTFQRLQGPALAPDCEAGAVVKTHHVSDTSSSAASAHCIRGSAALAPQLWTLESWKPKVPGSGR